MNPESRLIKNILLTLAAAVIGFLLAFIPQARRAEQPANNPPRPGSSGPRAATLQPPGDSALGAPRVSIHAYRASQPNQIILCFPSAERYHSFLEAIGSSAVRLLAQLDRLQALRLGYDDWNEVTQLLSEGGITNLEEVSSQPALDTPGGGIRDQAIGFGDSLLHWLGVTSDPSRWGAGVKIAVLDTGIVPHPALPGLRKSIEIVPFPDDLSNTNPHGTAVASLIAGHHPNASGLAPAAELISVRIAGESGSTDCFNMAAGILAAIDAGADLINISMGSLSSTPLEEAAVRLAQEAGIVIVAGTGNDGHDALRFPAGYAEVVSVGALDAGGERMQFSNHGERLTITAPGVNIFAAAPGNRYVVFSGTSASAPVVTGAIAATMSDGSGSFLDSARAVATILEHADDIGLPGADREYGAGILNLSRIMNRALANMVDAAITDLRILRTDEGDLIQVAVQNRGNTSLLNVLLEVAGPFGTRSISLGVLNPNEIRSTELPLDLIRIPPRSSFRVTASLRFPSQDQDVGLDDNRLVMDFTRPE